MAELYQVEFKGSRWELYYNTYYHTLQTNDYVIVQAEQGEDMGLLRAKIESEQQFNDKTRPRSILRRAGEEDLSRFYRLKEDEKRLKQEVIGVIAQHGLAMKVVDVECLFDGGKITFYFTADHRIDFRALVRDLASRYRTRIELRQIGVRDEAKRLDGFGICGRRQCCSSYLKDFAPISTSHAREQDLSLNPSKISGNCGRLLCCLRYEVDMYRDAKKKLPPIGVHVSTNKGCGKVHRLDIFQDEVLFFNEEQVLCRAHPKEITDVKGAQGKWQPPIPANEEPLDNGAREKLEKLDEPNHKLDDNESRED